MDKFVTRKKAKKVSSNSESDGSGSDVEEAPKKTETQGTKRKAEPTPLEGETKTKQVKASADAKPDAKISGLMSETVTEPGWKKVLAAEFAKPYYAEIEKYVAKERKTDTPIFPPHHEVYNAFNFTPYDKVKVVIIGQDPYFNPNQGEGLCFSVKKGVAIPPSLNRIYKVLAKTVPDFKIPKHGSLESWANQGVLLLNATLTVQSGKPNSHAKCGWQDFTTAVMKTLNKEKEGLVYLLWGGFAQKKGAVIDKKKNHVLTAAHPSPMGGASWNDCNHFMECNALLKKAGKEEIDWKIPD